MTSRAVKKCEDVMRELVKAGFTNQVSVTVLRKFIKYEIGGDPRTVKNWIRNLEDFEFIKKANVGVFKLDLGRVEGCLELAVKGEDRQKKLV